MQQPLQRIEGRAGLETRHWPRVIFLPCAGCALSSAFWQWGLSRTAATNSSLIANISPVFALILAVALGQASLIRRRIVGMLIALAGVLLVIQTDGMDLRGEALVGDLLLIASSLCWASFNVLSVTVLRVYSPLKVTAWALLLGSVTMALLSPWGAGNWNGQGQKALAVSRTRRSA